MAVWTFTGEANNEPSRPKLIASFKHPTRLYVQVYGNYSIYFAHEIQTLQNPAAGGQQGGLQVTALDGIKELIWEGDLFASGSQVGAQFDIEIMTPYTHL